MYLFNFYNKNGKFINFCIIKYQLLAITLDNASNNDTFVRKLSAKLQEETNIKWNSEDNRFRCFSHVLNLAAQAALYKIKDETGKVNIYFYISFDYYNILTVL